MDLRRIARAATGGLRRIPALLGSLALTVQSAAAQRPVKIVHFQMHLVDVSVMSDTVYGVHILVEPTINTFQGRASAAPVWLRFYPDTMVEWLNSAAAAIRATVPNAPAEGIQWSPTLRPIKGIGAFALGRRRKKGGLDKAHWLAVADSAEGWRAELSAAEADSLVRLLFALAVQSRVDTAAASAPDDQHVDSPAVPEYQPTPTFRGTSGRVLAQYVVGTDGRPEQASFAVLLAYEPELAADAWSVIRASRFRPALRKGAPVRQLVYQVIAWKPR